MRPSSLLCAGFILALPAPAAAEPWVLAPGDYYVRLANTTVFGTGGFMTDGSYVETGQSYIDTDFALYAEYGVGEALTLLGSATTLGYATMGPLATTYTGPLWLAARLRAPDLSAEVEGLEIGLEVQAGLNPGLGTRRIGAGLADGRIWEYAPGFERHQFAAALRLGYWLQVGTGWAGYLLIDAGARHESRPLDLGAIFYGAARLGLTSESGLEVEIVWRWHQPSGQIARHNLSGASGTRFAGARGAVTLWWSKNLGLYIAVEGRFIAAAARPGPYITTGLVHH